MQKVKLNLIPQGVPPVVYASQYDVGRQFQFEIYDGDVEYDIPSNATVTFQGVKPDSHVFVYSSVDSNPVVTFTGSVVTVTTTEQMTAIPRKALCEIIIRQSGILVGTLNAYIDVEKAAVPDDAEASASDLSGFENMTSQVQGAHQELIDTREYVGKARDDILKAQTDIDKNIKVFNDALNGSLSKIIHTTLVASNWTGSSAPYRYNLGDYDKKIVNVIYDTDSITQDQIEAAKSAGIYGSAGSVLLAYNEKPTVNIPVVIGLVEFIKS